ncbi:MAG: hemolysin III family protein, partial [Pseudomonadota bacterium]
ALRRVDHAAIFLKIAGTYTPLVVLIGSAFGYVVLTIVWAVAIAAASSKLIFAHWPRKLSLAAYLSLGWAAMFLVKPMIDTFDGLSVGLIILGAVLYTAGTVFFVWDRLKFQTAIWHGFVLAASACFFVAIALTL